MDMKKIIKPWQLDGQKTYCFRNANIVDPVEGTVVENASFVSSGGKLLYVGKDEEKIKQATEAAAALIDVDLGGKFVAPGLIDCHVHIAVVPGESDLNAYKDMSERVSLLRQPSVLRSMLQRGFTTVRDCGGASLAMKQAIEDGLHVGPRLFIAGRALSQTGGHGDMRSAHSEQECSCGSISGISRIVDGSAECFRIARDEIRQGADFIKIMGGGGVASPTDKIEHLQFSDEEIAAIVTVAKNAGTYVTSHSYTPEAIQKAIRLGVRGIEHGNLIDAETIRLMVQEGTFLTPTLVTHVVSKQLNFFTPASAAKNDEVLAKGLVALKNATEAGVNVCFGTDLLGPMHFAQSKEFSIRSQVQSPLQILRSATVTAARLLMQEDFLGQVKTGFAADVLVLDKNPLEDITSLDRVDETILAVIKDGRVVSSQLSGLKVEL